MESVAVIDFTIVQWNQLPKIDRVKTSRGWSSSNVSKPYFLQPSLLAFVHLNRDQNMEQSWLLPKRLRSRCYRNSQISLVFSVRPTFDFCTRHFVFYVEDPI